MSFCGNCGSTMPTGAAFCGECGRSANEPFSNPNVRGVAPDATTSVLPKILQATPEPPPIRPPVTSPLTTVVGTIPPSPSAATAYTAPAMQYDLQPVDPQPYDNGTASSTHAGRGGLLIALVLLGICAVGLGLYLVNNSKDSSNDSAVSTVAGATTVFGDTTTAATEASTIPVDPAIAAAEELSALVAQDRPIADTLVGSWVVQLSAKRVGLKADGIEYGPVEILADHTTLRTTYGAIVVDGGAFQFQSGGNPMTGWFLTIVPQLHATKDEARQFCTDRSLGSNVCLAREFKPPNP